MSDTLVERLAKLAGLLIEDRTVAHHEKALQDCFMWVGNYLHRYAPHADLRIFEDASFRSLLVAHGQGPARVLLCGHLDVVQGERSAFEPRRLPGNRLAGRGAADMKGPIAALLDVFASEPLAGLGIVLTTDEELGGEHGTKYVLDQLAQAGELPEVAVLPDGGANMRLIAEQKGVLRVRLAAHGLAAHGSRPWLGANAVERLMAGYRALLRAHPLPVNEDDWRPSIALTQLSTGDNAANSVPGHASATLDIRFPAERRSAEELLTDIRTRLARYHTVVESATVIPAFHLDVASPWVARLQQVARETRGAELPLAREAGASDGRFFSECGIPALIFQPECAGWHGPDEWVNLDSLAVFHEIVARFAREALV